MDPAHLRLLRELADRGSVAAVAAAHDVSPSAVSQQLAALQRRLPVPLTTRQGRRLVLTEAGQALADAGARVESALAEAEAAVDAFLAHDPRPVAVSAFHSAGVALFGPLLRVLDDRTPVALSDADVAQGDFPGLTADHDLVVAHRLPQDPEWPARLAVTRLLDEPIDIALSSTHPLAIHDELVVAQLRDERWVSTHPGFPLTGVLEHVGALVGRAPRVVHRVNEFSVAAQIVRTGAAIAMMPRVAGAALATDGMVLRPVQDARLVRRVDVLARPDALAHARVRTVLQGLREVARAVPGAVPPEAVEGS